jgi:hypothetical protein
MIGRSAGLGLLCITKRKLVRHSRRNSIILKLKCGDGDAPHHLPDGRGRSVQVAADLSPDMA